MQVTQDLEYHALRHSGVCTSKQQSNTLLLETEEKYSKLEGQHWNREVNLHDRYSIKFIL